MTMVELLRGHAGRSKNAFSRLFRSTVVDVHGRASVDGEKPLARPAQSGVMLSALAARGRRYNLAVTVRQDAAGFARVQQERYWSSIRNRAVQSR